MSSQRRRPQTQGSSPSTEICPALNARTQVLPVSTMKIVPSSPTATPDGRYSPETTVDTEALVEIHLADLPIAQIGHVETLALDREAPPES